MPAVRNIHKLIEFFSSFTVLPVNPDDVRDQILSYGVKDEIEFVGVNLDRRIMLGAFHQYVVRSAVYADPMIHVDIYYDRSLSRDWKRVVCCKELLHILDHSTSKAATPSDCENLIAGMATMKLDTPFSIEKAQAWSDQLMLFYAMAVLFPWDAREVVYDDYRQDPTKLGAIAKAADLPEVVVVSVLSDYWPKLYASVSGQN
jgi:hypothetical protein